MMLSVPCFNFRFTPSWGMIILVMLCMSLFVRLGFWQLERAHEKKNMLHKESRLAQQDAKIWSVGNKLPLQYQKIKVQGSFLSQVFFLDNQHYQHQFGYNVLSPLLLHDGSIVMVDRGWIKGDNNRNNLPSTRIPKGILPIHGSAYYPSKKQWVLGAEIEKQTNQVWVLELLNTKLLSHVLQKKVYPFIIRLEKHEKYGYVREWTIVSMPPERHFAYALQWFVMALVIFIIFIALNVKKNDEKSC